MDLTQFVANNLAAIIAVPIAYYLIQKTFTDLEKRLDSLESSLSSKDKSDQHNQIELRDKITSVLDLTLTKFSKWEDRIKRVLDQMMAITNDKETPSAKHDINQVISDFHRDLVDDVDDIKTKTFELTRQLGNVESKVEIVDGDSVEYYNDVRQMIKNIGQKVESFTNEYTLRLENDGLLLRRTYQILSYFNGELKLLKDRVDNLPKSKIVLVDDKEKH